MAYTTIDTIYVLKPSFFSHHGEPKFHEYGVGLSIARDLLDVAYSTILVPSRLGLDPAIFNCIGYS